MSLTLIRSCTICYTNKCCNLVLSPVFDQRWNQMSSIIQSATSKTTDVRVHKWFSSEVVESALNREKENTTIMENNGGKWWCGSAVSTRASSTNESRVRGLSTNHGPLTPHSATSLEGTSFFLSSLPLLCSVDLLCLSRQIQRSSWLISRTM